MTMIASETKSFTNLVDNWVLDAIASGTTAFDQLVTSLPGVYPSLVLQSLQHLASLGLVSWEILTEAKSYVGQRQQQLVSSHHRIKLPIPHPLDYDWRFSDSAVEHLLDECLLLSNLEDTVALLGVPSVLRLAIERKYPRQMILLDSNPLIEDCLDEGPSSVCVKTCDIGKDQLPDIASSIVIVDPPWYEESMQAFLWAASHLCAIGGHILVSTPAIGTRPGIDQEWAKFLNWAQKIGLTLIRVESAVLPYISPPFERNALRTEGLYSAPSQWRHGDLAIFSHTHHTATERPIVPPCEGKWVEEVLLGVRVRIRHSDEQDFEDPSLLTVVPGDVLPSVSRRDGRRGLADIWTSGNRIFACRGRNVLRQILHSLAVGQSAHEVLAAMLNRKLSDREVELILQTIQQLTEVVCLEWIENLRFEEEL
jgi:hypothetical protein